MAYELHRPGEARTYSFDWDDGPWLATGDSVASATWAITPSAGVTLEDLGEASNVSSVKVSTLTRGEIYLLTCDMVSTDGETGQQNVAIRCDY